MMLKSLLAVVLECAVIAGAQTVPNTTITDSNTSVKFQVAGNGGNATSPFQYGIMFEVWDYICSIMHVKVRSSSTS